MLYTSRLVVVLVDHEEAVLVGVVAVCMVDASHATQGDVDALAIESPGSAQTVGATIIP